MKKTQWIFIAALLVVIAIIAVLLVGQLKEYKTKQTVQPVQLPVTVEKPAPIEEPIQTMTIAMIGDLLLHTGLVGYVDYSSSFSPMETVLHNYDFLMANQESLPVGNKFSLAGYPQFSSPDYLLRDVKEVGVDLVNIANNHVVDKGEEGVTTLFENLAQYDLPYMGAYQDEQDAMTDRIVEVNGISIGLLSYTYGTNGLYLPKDSPYLINYIDDAKIQEDMAVMKPKVDVLAVHMHWGPEFTTQENSEQHRLAALINEAGADIIFGTHPHMLQPYDKLTSTAGQETHVFYSLGNYFSLTTTSKDSMIGGVASLTVTKQGESLTITEPTFIATSMLLDADGVYRVHPLAGNEQRSVRDLSWVKQVIGEGAIVQ